MCRLDAVQNNQSTIAEKDVPMNFFVCLSHTEDAHLQNSFCLLLFFGSVHTLRTVRYNSLMIFFLQDEQRIRVITIIITVIEIKILPVANDNHLFILEIFFVLN